MDLEDNLSSQNSVNTPRRTSLMEVESQKSSAKDIFKDMLAQSRQMKNQQEDDVRNIFNRQARKMASKKIDMRKILNSSSSNQRLPSSLKNDSFSLQHSDRPRNNVYETENSMDQQSFRKSFKKRDQSFSVQNTIRDSSSSFSQHSDSKSQQNLNILAHIYKEQENYEQKKSGCNCKRSKCLKMYCQCFYAKKYCSENCNCHDCGNNQSNPAQHQKAIHLVLSRNPFAFNQQFNPDNTQKMENNGFRLGVQKEQVKKGCKCKKTRCLKKYCECYGSGVQCGVFCRCEDCFNTQFHLKK